MFQAAESSTLHVNVTSTPDVTVSATADGHAHTRRAPTSATYSGTSRRPVGRVVWRGRSIGGTPCSTTTEDVRGRYVSARAMGGLIARRRGICALITRSLAEAEVEEVGVPGEVPEVVHLLQEAVLLPVDCTVLPVQDLILPVGRRTTSHPQRVVVVVSLQLG